MKFFLSNQDVVPCVNNTEILILVESSFLLSQLDADGQVVQIVRVRNIAISEAEEDFQVFSSSTTSSSRLLRLTLTDGKSNISALDVDNSPKLSYVLAFLIHAKINFYLTVFFVFIQTCYSFMQLLVIVGIVRNRSVLQL